MGARKRPPRNYEEQRAIVDIVNDVAETLKETRPEPRKELHPLLMATDHILKDVSPEFKDSIYIHFIEVARDAAASHKQQLQQQQGDVQYIPRTS